MPHAGPIRIRVLGHLEVLRGDERVELPPSRKTRALLAYLALTGRSHTRDRLCELFWDDVDRPRDGLRWALSKLRSAVDEGDRRGIVANRTTVELDGDVVWVDAVHVRRRCSTGLENLSTEELRELVDVFRGELLEGLDFAELHAVQAWCVGERGDARRLHTSLLKELVRRPQHTDSTSPAVGCSRTPPP